MTIRNFTFFSPTGTEFPVSSNADAKLYLMLSSMKLDAYKRTDWEQPVDTALNRQYSNTSLVVGGRYFELEAETVALQPSVDNYIHANIDLSNPTAPVSLSVELADNSNNIDINNASGVLKRCFDIVTTDGMSVIGAKAPKMVSTFDVVSPYAMTNDTAPVSINGSGAPSGKVTYERKNGVVYVSGGGNWGTLTAGVSKTVVTLPVGFRPQVEKQVAGNAMGGTDSNSWGVRPNGEVVVTNRPGGTNRYSAWSISYPYYE